MRKRYLISVREKGDLGGPGKEIDKICRVLTSESIGSFNPVYCRYENKKYLVQSFEGDLSDPFRRDESYLKNLYIEVV